MSACPGGDLDPGEARLPPGFQATGQQESPFPAGSCLLDPAFPAWEPAAAVAAPRRPARPPGLGARRSPWESPSTLALCLMGLQGPEGARNPSEGLCTGCGTWQSLTSPLPSSCGKGLPHTYIKVKDEEEEDIGNICIWGRNVFMGYLNDKKGIQKVMDSYGWVTTKDLGYLDVNNFLYISGNVKGETRLGLWGCRGQWCRWHTAQGPLSADTRLGGRATLYAWAAALRGGAAVGQCLLPDLCLGLQGAIWMWLFGVDRPPSHVQISSP